MKRSVDKKYLVLGISLGILLISILIVCFTALRTKQENPDSWIIRSYDNTVVLLNNGEVVEVFGDIVLDTLPTEDQEHLESGISFLTKDEAMMALEDYDG